MAVMGAVEPGSGPGESETLLARDSSMAAPEGTYQGWNVILAQLGTSRSSRRRRPKPVGPCASGAKAPATDQCRFHRSPRTTPIPAAISTDWRGFSWTYCSRLFSHSRPPPCPARSIRTLNREVPRIFRWRHCGPEIPSRECSGRSGRPSHDFVFCLFSRVGKIACCIAHA